MEGFKSPYVPGWDCHGLPIEHQVLKNLGPKKEGMSQNEIRKLCREYAEKFIDIQREEFKRLGVFGDWDNPYLTMNYRLRGRHRARTRQVRREQAASIKERSRCTGAGPDETALAEAEVEYADHESPSVYVRFALPEAEKALPSLNGKEGFDRDLDHDALDAVANLAVALHPEFDYVAVETERTRC